MISVIVPIYNTAKYLPRCIDSILGQTYKDLEIILLDDGSEDNSYEIMRNYAQKDSRVRVVKLDHQGVAVVRKTGVEMANGEFIGFIDSDDYVEPDMYSRLYETMTETNCDLVSSDVFVDNIYGDKYMNFDNYKKGLYTDLYHDIYPTMLHDYALNSKGLRCYLFPKLFRSDMLKETVKNIDTHVFYSEDAMILYRYCLDCKSIYIMREAFYHYDMRQNSAETKINKNEPENMYRLFENLKEAFENSPYADVLMPQLYQYALLLHLRVFRGVYNVDLWQINNWIFLDIEKLYNKRIVVYGAGVCGQAFCKDMLRSGHVDKIVAWVDKRPENTSEWELRYKNAFQDTPLRKPQSASVLKNLDYDYIVVAIKKEAVASEAMEELQEKWGVPADKILPVKVGKKNLAAMMLSAYL